VYALLLISSFYISIVDIAIHKIRNRTLIFLGIGFSVITLLGNGEVYLVSAFAIFSIGFIATFFGLGAGDVKLATVLALFFLTLEAAKLSDLFTGFIAGSTLLLIAHLIARKSLADPIALSPAICAAFIWCAR